MTRSPWFRMLVLAPALLAGSALAEAPPDAATVEKLIAATREIALAYDSRLPDFICTQITRRETHIEANPAAGVRTGGSRGASIPGAPADPGWKTVDSIEQQLAYFGHRETYQTVAVNGKRLAQGEEPTTGLTSTGEFGSTLGGIFDPLSHAEIKWKRWDKLRGQPVYVLSYAIAKENSASVLSAGSQRVVAAYQGLLFVERQTNTVIRVTTEAEVPEDFPLQHVTRALDYGRVAIAGETFLLPLRSETESRATEEFMQTGRTGSSSSPIVTLRNRIEFKGYRKYGVESILKPE